MIPMTMMIFCIFEYCRFFMIWNLVKNAAREGCRYALVNNTSATLTTDVTTIVTSRLAGQSGTLSGLTVSVSGTHLGVNTSLPNLYPGDLITVSVTGHFSFMNIVPMVPMPTSITISSAVVMVCEGGT